MQTTIWLVHEPFHYARGADRTDFRGEFATEGRLAYFLRFGRWEGTAVAGRFCRRMRLGRDWWLEEGVVVESVAEWKEVPLTVRELGAAVRIPVGGWEFIGRRMEDVK